MDCSLLGAMLRLVLVKSPLQQCHAGMRSSCELALLKRTHTAAECIIVHQAQQGGHARF